MHRARVVACLAAAAFGAHAAAAHAPVRLDKAGARDVAAVMFGASIRVHGSNPEDRRIGKDLRRYLLRNAGSERWLGRVKAIVVDRGVIAVATELRRNRRGRRVARLVCQLIQGADVADFTSGHTVLGHQAVVLRRCPARRR